MTNEEKQQLLLKDLCARLPYNVKIAEISGGTLTTSPRTDVIYVIENGGKPYLRPMSSMTDEEKTKIASMSNFNNITKSAEFVKCSYPIIDYCCSRHLDFRGLISKGLALEAPGGMYK